MYVYTQGFFQEGANVLGGPLNFLPPHLKSNLKWSLAPPPPKYFFPSLIKTPGSYIHIMYVCMYVCRCRHCWMGVFMMST